jgi:hypothetical protein
VALIRAVAFPHTPLAVGTGTLSVAWRRSPEPEFRNPKWICPNLSQKISEHGVEFPLQMCKNEVVKILGHFACS